MICKNQKGYLRAGWLDPARGSFKIYKSFDPNSTETFDMSGGRANVSLKR